MRRGLFKGDRGCACRVAYTVSPIYEHWEGSAVSAIACQKYFTKGVAETGADA
ncbi:hypothetical protein SAMN05443026_1659 [Burkholderia orbicola]|nr:hypothetical protein SAMN05443026_1659 [Burkholderia orbicola]